MVSALPASVPWELVESFKRAAYSSSVMARGKYGRVSPGTHDLTRRQQSMPCRRRCWIWKFSQQANTKLQVRLLVKGPQGTALVGLSPAPRVYRRTS